MARAKSAVLSAADKRAVIKDLKAKAKEANAAVKAAEKAKALAAKTFEKAQATAEKELAKLTKAADKLNSELAAITGANDAAPAAA